ncbi:hypothetical protein NX862_13045 [Rhodobacter sp. KR11]|jgi:hypothetical protein|uniref:hypothetical protein n=1 Tax=Rhodobacter sp. KR11 TaxID=2974588 RepID=UPI0022225923|nr:hypothetical protein [Rhodobacter sp. KR11]MCW1919683.1 hypothetical protein [Rhodobacter sp. KR11]
MDYSKSGNPKGAKARPAFDGQNRFGAPKQAHGNTPSKEELLARLKAAAEKKKEA